MYGKILEIIIILIAFIIISIIMDLKIKNFILEIYKHIFFVFICFVLFVDDVTSTNGLIAETYKSIIKLLIPFAIIGTYTVLNKNKIYYLKGIDISFIKENTNKISRIIDDY